MMTILESSADAMEYVCPVCNAPKLTKCVNPGGKVCAAVVHPERRALVSIIKPGRQVRWQDGIGIVK